MKSLGQKGLGTMPMVGALAAAVLLGLAAYYVGMPQYQNYQVQNQVAAALASANACRPEISLAVQKATAPQLSTGLFACDGGASSGVKISPHLKSIAVSPAGAITVTLDFRSLPELTPATNILTLVPMLDAANMVRVGDAGKKIQSWRCGSPQDGTTIPSQYLPSDCRG